MCGHTGKDMETTCFDRWQDWILSQALCVVSLFEHPSTMCAGSEPGKHAFT